MLEGLPPNGAAFVMWLETDEATARTVADLIVETFDPTETAAAAFEKTPSTESWDSDIWVAEVFFGPEPDEEAIRELVASVAGEKAAKELVFGRVSEKDWIAASLEGLAPVRAGRFLVHGSHDRAAPRVNDIGLEIEAALAFGTGHHGTTAGCLLALDHILKRQAPQRIFDLGCGTGVLAIAAAQATRRPVLATDIDPEAVRVTLENARINALRPLTRAQTAAGLHHPVIRRQAPYDLIFANILARPLAALAQGLSTLLAPGGHLILSGLTREQLRWIKACYLARGLTHSRTLFMGNWVALVMTRPQRPGAKAKRPGSGPGRLQITSRAPGWELDA